jgi:hypothetical protein
MASDSQNPKDKIGYNFTAAYLTTAFTITEGLDYLVSKLVGTSHLYFCGKCNSLIYGISSDPAKQQGIGININNLEFPAGIPSSFKPIRHIWYPDRITDISDELPKFINSPKDQLGTGELFLE